MIETALISKKSVFLLLFSFESDLTDFWNTIVESFSFSFPFKKKFVSSSFFSPFLMENYTIYNFMLKFSSILYIIH